MRIGIVAATQTELNGLPELLSNSGHELSFIEHGVGMLQACFQLSLVVRQDYDLLIQCGVAGSYSPDIQPGEAVLVHAEIMGDLGAEDHAQFLDLFELGLADKNAFPFRDGKLLNDYVFNFASFKAVRSISVNCVAGRTGTIAQRIQHTDPEIESMEGAAFHYCCLMADRPFLQVRGISNMVEPRNRDNWQLPDAIRNSHFAVKTILDQLTTTTP